MSSETRSQDLEAVRTCLDLDYSLRELSEVLFHHTDFERDSKPDANQHGKIVSQTPMYTGC
eukprot:1330639-Amorphochlora_amoeboformis.AAC.1